MNITVARKLHERRFRASPMMTTGEMLNLIGSEGVQEALLKRWIVPETDSGMLMLNLHGGKMVELECACRCRCGKTDCSCNPEAVVEASYTMPMREAFAGFGLPAPGPGVAAPPTATPTAMVQQPAKAPAAADETAPKVGDEAMVAEGDKTYTGKVASVSNNGRVRLTFGATRPSEERDYGFNEVQVTKDKNAQRQ